MRAGQLAWEAVLQSRSRASASWSFVGHQYLFGHLQTLKKALIQEIIGRVVIDQQYAV